MMALLPPKLASTHPRVLSQPSIREGHDDYISSVFANIGRATFISTASNAKGPSKAFTASASLAGLSFKGQFLRLALAEPVGSHANPGRQVLLDRGHQRHAT